MEHDIHLGIESHQLYNINKKNLMLLANQI